MCQLTRDQAEPRLTASLRSEPGKARWLAFWSHSVINMTCSAEPLQNRTPPSGIPCCRHKTRRLSEILNCAFKSNVSTESCFCYRGFNTVHDWFLKSLWRTQDQVQVQVQVQMTQQEPDETVFIILIQVQVFGQPTRGCRVSAANWTGTTSGFILDLILKFSGPFHFGFLKLITAERNHFRNLSRWNVSLPFNGEPTRDLWRQNTSTDKVTRLRPQQHSHKPFQGPGTRKFAENSETFLQKPQATRTIPKAHSRNPRNRG